MIFLETICTVRLAFMYTTASCRNYSALVKWFNGTNGARYCKHM